MHGYEILPVPAKSTKGTETRWGAVVWAAESKTVAACGLADSH